MKNAKSLSRPSTISEEYVVDSEEEDAVSEPGSPTSVSEKPSLKRKRSPMKTTANPKNIPAVETEITSENEGSDGSKDEGEETQSDALVENPRQNSETVSEAQCPSKSKATISRLSVASIPGSRYPMLKLSSTRKSRKSAAPGIPAKPFNAPDGFILSTPSDQNGDKQTDSLLSNLKGKGVWHITAPPSVPLTAIQQFALDAIATGERVLSMNGNDYALRSEIIKPTNQRRLLLLDRQRESYKASPFLVSQTLHLQQIVDPPHAFEQSEEQLSQAITEANSMPYLQPKEMKMRYRPFGTEEVSLETSRSSASDESDEDQPSFRVSPDPKSAKRLEAKQRTKQNVEASLVKSLEMDGGREGKTSNRKTKTDHPTIEQPIPIELSSADSASGESENGLERDKTGISKNKQEKVSEGNGPTEADIRLVSPMKGKKEKILKGHGWGETGAFTSKKADAKGNKKKRQRGIV